MVYFIILILLKCSSVILCSCFTNDKSALLRTVTRAMGEIEPCNITGVSQLNKYYNVYTYDEHHVENMRCDIDLWNIKLLLSICYSL